MRASFPRHQRAGNWLVQSFLRAFHQKHGWAQMNGAIKLMLLIRCLSLNPPGFLPHSDYWTFPSCYSLLSWGLRCWKLLLYIQCGTLWKPSEISAAILGALSFIYCGRTIESSELTCAVEENLGKALLHSWSHCDVCCWRDQLKRQLYENRINRPWTCK